MHTVPATHPVTATGSSTPALYVDMDGALCATDTLWESLMELARRAPHKLFQVPFWVLKGKAEFKSKVADHVLPDIATLPLRAEVIELIKSRRAAGQSVVLATAADVRIAQAMAARVGQFDAVLASDGRTNLAADNKLAAIRRHSGNAEFDYLGDSHADVCILRACRQGYVAGNSESVWRAANTQRTGSGTLTRLVASGPKPKGLLSAIRPHQWAKNFLIGVPILVSHRITDFASLRDTALAFVAFSGAASSVYLVNDLLDLAADRVHPTKQRRPFASGAVPIPKGLITAVLLLTGALTLAFTAIGPLFGALLLLYLASSTLYSSFLKRKLLLDVFMLAGLYTLRILAGAVAIEVRPSEWLLAFSVFVFTSLAMVKRCAELKTWSKLDEKWPAGRRYTVSDMDLLRSGGLASAYASVLVFAQYISSKDVALLYHRPTVLWMVCPVLMYWLTRLWFLTNRNRVLDDPVLFALKDRASLACGAAVILLIFVAT